MSELDTWQLPSSDDISPEALEYLFAPKFRPQEEPPWVKVSVESEEVAVKSQDALRLQAKLEVVTSRLEAVSTQLQRAVYHIGYLKGRLLEKEEQVKSLPEIRVRAAQAIAFECELGALKLQLRSLQQEVTDFRSNFCGKVYSLSKAIAGSGNTSGSYQPLVPWIMLAVLLSTMASFRLALLFN